MCTITVLIKIETAGTEGETSSKDDILTGCESLVVPAEPGCVPEGLMLSAI